MKVQKIKIGKLKAAAYNPRKDLQPGDAEYEKLKRSIENFGYVEPVIWNKTTGNVVGGHQRLKVLADLGQTEIDCVVVELDDANEKALNLALNKIDGAWDKNKLAKLFGELSDADFDVLFTGFDPYEITELFDFSDVPEEHHYIKGEKGKISSAPSFNFARYNFSAEKEEWDELMERIKKYEKENGSLKGFIRWLLGGVKREES